MTLAKKAREIGIKPEALAEQIVREAHNNIDAAARNTGYPRSTIVYWLNRGGWQVVSNPQLERIESQP